MRKFASLSTEFLKDTGRQFHKFMKSGRLPKVLKLAGFSK